MGQWLDNTNKYSTPRYLTVMATNGDKIKVMFVDPCTIVKFVKENPTRCNNISKFSYSIFI